MGWTDEGRRGPRLLIGVIRRQGHGLRSRVTGRKIRSAGRQLSDRAPLRIDKIVDLCLHTRFT